MGSSSKQKPPDVVGAARETGEQERALSQEQTIANRPDQYNPWGSTTWGATPTWDPVSGQMVNRWTQTETLNPQLQAILDAQMGVGQQRAGMATDAMGRAAEDFRNPFDFGQFGSQDTRGIDYGTFDTAAQRQAAEDAAYGRATSRLDPQFQAQEQALMVRLTNQGLRPGDRAYDSAIENFQRGRNDAYEQARMAATGEGRSEASLLQQMHQAGFGQAMTQQDMANALRQQQMQEALFQRGFNLDEAQRLLSGIEVTGATPSGTTEGQ